VSFVIYQIFCLVISYLNKQLNDLQLRSENTTRNPQWFSTPNDGNGVAPKIPMSTLRASPLQLGQTLENRSAYFNLTKRSLKSSRTFFITEKMTSR
jgi:hypothetical protein